MASGETHRIFLVVERGEHRGYRFLLEEGDNIIGRWDPDAGAFPEIDLSKVDVEAKVSRKHAMVRRDGDKITLTDLGSLNGTFVNRGARLAEGKECDLKSGDELILGKSFLRLEAE